MYSGYYNTVNNNNKKFMSLKKASHKIIIDSGASACGTGLRDTLQDIRPTSCSVSAAFGESAQPTEMGLLPPFMLKTVVIEQMNDTTLLSVSQACAQGLVGLFTSKACVLHHHSHHQRSQYLPSVVLKLRLHRIKRD